MTHHGSRSAPTSQARNDGRTLLSLSQRQRTDALLAQQQGYGWRGDLPVLLLERCWLRLNPVSVQGLGQVLPPRCKWSCAGAGALSGAASLRA